MRADCSAGSFAAWCAAALVAVAASAERAQAQRITGLVVEEGSRTPVREAQVVLFAPEGAIRAEAVTDSSGVFAFSAPAGEYSLHVDRLGYEAYTSPFLELGDAEAVSLEIRLGIGAVPLEPLIVTARSVQTRGRATEFHERRTDPARPGGYFLTREDMERGIGGRTTDVLARVPVILLRPTAPRGAPPEQGMGTYLIHLRGSGGGSNSSCAPALYVDGVRFSQSSATTVDDFTEPGRLEGVEVYARASFVPAQYAVGNACGVLLFWTRPAEDGSDWNWKRIAVGAAGLTLIFGLMFR